MGAEGQMLGWGPTPAGRRLLLHLLQGALREAWQALPAFVPCAVRWGCCSMCIGGQATSCLSICPVELQSLQPWLRGCLHCKLPQHPSRTLPQPAMQCYPDLYPDCLQGHHLQHHQRWGPHHHHYHHCQKHQAQCRAACVLLCMAAKGHSTSA